MLGGGIGVPTWWWIEFKSNTSFSLEPQFSAPWTDKLIICDAQSSKFHHTQNFFQIFNFQHPLTVSLYFSTIPPSRSSTPRDFCGKYRGRRRAYKIDMYIDCLALDRVEFEFDLIFELGSNILQHSLQIGAPSITRVSPIPVIKFVIFHQKKNL